MTTSLWVFVDSPFHILNPVMCYTFVRVYDIHYSGQKYPSRGYLVNFHKVLFKMTERIPTLCKGTSGNKNLKKIMYFLLKKSILKVFVYTTVLYYLLTILKSHECDTRK